MDEGWVRGRALVGRINILDDLPLEEVALRVGKALGLKFSEDPIGRYDEFTAFLATGAGFKFELIDVRAESLQERGGVCFQFVASSEQDAEALINLPGHAIELSNFYAELLKERTKLLCQSREVPNAA